MEELFQNVDAQRFSIELRLIKERVQRLERGNRMLKVVNLVALAAVVATTRIPGIWATPTTSISAEKFILESPSGKTLATLGVNASGFPSLTFFDASGKRLTQVGEADNGKSAGVYGFDDNALLAGKGVLRASFGISSAGAGEAEYDGNGIQRVGISIAASSSVDGLVLFDANKVVRATMLETAAPIFDGFSVALDDANGKIRSSMYVQNAISTTTYTGFSLTDPNGVGRASFSEPLSETASTGGPFLVLEDANGKSRVSMFVENSITTGFGGMSLIDANGIIRSNYANELTDSFGTESGPFLIFEDINGNPRASLFVNNSLTTGGAGLALFDAEFAKTNLDRTFFGENLSTSDGLILFNNAAGKSIGGWLPPAAPTP